MNLDNGKYSGLCIELLDVLATTLNFRSVLKKLNMHYIHGGGIYRMYASILKMNISSI